MANLSMFEARSCRGAILDVADLEVAVFLLNSNRGMKSALGASRNGRLAARFMTKVTNTKLRSSIVSTAVT